MFFKRLKWKKRKKGEKGENGLPGDVQAAGKSGKNAFRICKF